MKAVGEYPAPLQDTVRTLRKLQSSIDRNDVRNDELRDQRDAIIDDLIEGGMGPKEALGIIGLRRNLYYQRKKNPERRGGMRKSTT